MTKNGFATDYSNRFLSIHTSLGAFAFYLSTPEPWFGTAFESGLLRIFTGWSKLEVSVRETDLVEWGRTGQRHYG
jgi:hypothetical protein